MAVEEEEIIIEEEVIEEEPIAVPAPMPQPIEEEVKTQNEKSKKVVIRRVSKAERPIHEGNAPLYTNR